MRLCCYIKVRHYKTLQGAKILALSKFCYAEVLPCTFCLRLCESRANFSYQLLSLLIFSSQALLTQEDNGSFPLAKLMRSSMAPNRICFLVELSCFLPLIGFSLQKNVRTFFKFHINNDNIVRTLFVVGGVI